MNKFKRIFYPVYIITIVLVIAISWNIMDSITLFQHWGFWKYLHELPFAGRNLILYLASLMVIEIIAENISIIRLKKQIEDHDDEVVGLKAKLYDKAEGEGDEDAQEDADDNEDD